MQWSYYSESASCLGSHVSHCTWICLYYRPHVGCILRMTNSLYGFTHQGSHKYSCIPNGIPLSVFFNLEKLSVWF